MGKSISLQLEHKNGNHQDNRIENLTILCPNCHSQTETFCRKKSSLSKDKIQKEQNKDNKKKIKDSQEAQVELVIKKQLQTNEKNVCKDCSKPISKIATKCKSCVAFEKGKEHLKINWPENDELIDTIKNSNVLAVSKKLGVSDNAIRHRLKRRGLLDKI